MLAEAYPKERSAFGEKQISKEHRARVSPVGLLDKVRFEMWPGDLFRYPGPTGTPPPPSRVFGGKGAQG